MIQLDSIFRPTHPKTELLYPVHNALLPSLNGEAISLPAVTAVLLRTAGSFPGVFECLASRGDVSLFPNLEKSLANQSKKKLCKPLQSHHHVSDVSA